MPAWRRLLEFSLLGFPNRRWACAGGRGRTVPRFLTPCFPRTPNSQHPLADDFKSGVGVGRACARAVATEAADRTPYSVAGYEGPGSVLVSPVPHQMLPYMNVGTLSRTELQLLNQLHCRRKRRHRTIFTDEQLEALENLFQETKYPDVGTREQLARKVHLREEKVEVGARPRRGALRGPSQRNEAPAGFAQLSLGLLAL